MLDHIAHCSLGSAGNAVVFNVESNCGGDKKNSSSFQTFDLSPSYYNQGPLDSLTLYFSLDRSFNY